MRRLIILLSCVSILFCGKDHKNPVQPQRSNDIWPLALGNYWNFEMVYYNDLGYEVSRDTTEFSVVRDTLIEGERWYKLAINGSEYSGWCVNRTDGYWFGGPPGNIYYKYPVQTGDQYVLPNGGIANIESDSNVVNVTAGEFICVSYVFNIPGRNDFERSKLSPGFGMVWLESWQETNDHQMFLYGRMTLQSYLVQ